MCGRFTIVPTIDFHERFGLPAGAVMSPRYNVAPGQEVPVIVRGDRNHAVPMIWGLVPPFAKDPVGGRPMINARAETLLERPAFREAVQKNRCLVPASGFYEWKKEGKRKVPFYIRLKTTPIFAFAGLYEIRRDPARGELATFTIITTKPNELVAGLHDRMPAILPRGKEEDWIRAGVVGPAELSGILAPYLPGEMEAFPVSGKVNDPRSEGPGLIQPLPGLTCPGTSLFPPGT
ncbi:MAG: SOS response-associated peptidase [Methanomicrobiales archaeon]|jgi:putative SOS response-associated peptidase YedK